MNERNRVRQRSAVLAAGAMLAASASTTSAQPSIEPINGFAGRIYVDHATGQQFNAPPPVSGMDVYSSVGLPVADWGWSSPDLNNVEIGDWGKCTARGLLHECEFTVYNGAASTSAVTSLRMTLKLYNELQENQPPGDLPPQAQILGTFSVDLTWPAGLQAGWYSLVTVTNLDALGINLPAITTGINPPPARFMWTQTTSNVVGGSRVGFANNSTVTLGSSGQSLYIHDSTHPPVYELLNNPQTFSNPGFRLNLCAPPSISVQPASAAACRMGSAQFSVAAGPEPLSFQWQVQTAPGVWHTMGNDPAPLPCGGGAFSYAAPINSPNVTIGIRPCPGSPIAPQHFQIRAVVTNACGSATSDEATYTICPADFNCSGATSVQDIFDFLGAYFSQDPRADVNASGAVSVQDVFDFLGAYFVGCS